MRHSVCLICAERNIFRWAYTPGFCQKHSPPEAQRTIHHKVITAQEAR